MKSKVGTSILFGALTLFSAAGLAGCGSAEQSVQPSPQVNKENAAMRTQAPLVRPVVLNKAGEMVNLEFELPPPNENASSTLLLGIRVVAPNVEAALQRSSEIFHSHLSARIRLIRIEQDSIVQIPLFRNTSNLQDRLAVGADGAVPGVTHSDVEITQLESAGLYDEARIHRVLMLAGAQNAIPGHYRLTMELDQDHPELGSEPVELIVAYMGKGK